MELDVLVDAEPGDADADSLRDVPLSFDPLHRRYRLRGVKPGRVAVPNPKARRFPDHDPTMPLMRGD